MNEQDTNEETHGTGKLAAAVAAVMGEVRRLEKADNNAFAKYRFTSVDDYKDGLRPLLAKHGLAPCLSQTGFERFEHAAKSKDSGVHCQYDFELWLEHASGEAGKVEGSTICLPYTGAQTTGQARSYVQKEWLKSKFLASSGDVAEDADSFDQDIKLSKGDARAIHGRLIKELRVMGTDGTASDMNAWKDRNSVLLDAMPNDWMVDLRHEGKQAAIAIKERELAGPQIELPTDIEAWLGNLDAGLADCATADELSHVWSEVQARASALPAEESSRAFQMHDKHKQRLAAQA